MRNVTNGKNLTGLSIIKYCQISAGFPYKYMYVIGKYLKFIGKKWFSSKCNLGVGGSLMVKRLVQYATLILEPVVISPFYGHCCLSSDPFFRIQRLICHFFNDYRKLEIDGKIPYITFDHDDCICQYI